MASVFQPNVFQGGGVFQVEAADEVDQAAVGSSISGGTFSRGRWRKLREDEEQARESARRGVARIEAQAREAARKKTAEERAKVEARRAAEDQAAADRAKERLLSTQPGVDAIMRAAQSAMALRQAALQAQAEQDEEEEAIALLLLNG